MSDKKTTWLAVMELADRDTRHVPGDVANNLEDHEVETILATYDFFGCSGEMLGQIAHDLAPAGMLRDLGFRNLMAPRFRVFDWLVMMVQTGGETLRVHGAYAATQVMAHSFLKCEGDVDRFIDDLRCSDYDCDRSWESLELGH